MPWFAWVVVANLVLSGAVIIYRIGKPRPAYTNGTALLALFELGLMAWAVVELGMSRG